VPETLISMGGFLEKTLPSVLAKAMPPTHSVWLNARAWASDAVQAAASRAAHFFVRGGIAEIAKPELDMSAFSHRVHACASV
jgi:hypothetical protein